MSSRQRSPWNLKIEASQFFSRPFVSAFLSFVCVGSKCDNVFKRIFYWNWLKKCSFLLSTDVSYPNDAYRVLWWKYGWKLEKWSLIALISTIKLNKRWVRESKQHKIICWLLCEWKLLSHQTPTCQSSLGFPALWKQDFEEDLWTLHLSPAILF